ncbi:MAG TPA: hypothetical protein VEW74_04750 [Candidatus Nitrosotalea sp.]|nr:hypothetical protein [Candidatus Nitrosotalea sp.]
MTLRKVPGAIALGLLASLAAHAALYGDGHAMGGAYHALLLEAGIGGALSLLLFFGGLAWVESGLTADGSVLAVRLRERLPGLGAILAATCAWYAAGEGLEPHHGAASPLALAIVLAAAAWLVARLAHAVADAFARAAVATQSSSFVPRTPLWKRRERVRPLYRRVLLARRRFARPPPILVLTRA